MLFWDWWFCGGGTSVNMLRVSSVDSLITCLPRWGQRSIVHERCTRGIERIQQKHKIDRFRELRNIGSNGISTCRWSLLEAYRNVNSQLNNKCTHEHVTTTNEVIGLFVGDLSRRPGYDVIGIITQSPQNT